MTTWTFLTLQHTIQFSNYVLYYLFTWHKDNQPRGSEKSKRIKNHLIITSSNPDNDQEPRKQNMAKTHLLFHLTDTASDPPHTIHFPQTNLQDLYLLRTRFCERFSVQFCKADCATVLSLVYGSMAFRLQPSTFWSEKTKFINSSDD